LVYTAAQNDGLAFNGELVEEVMHEGRLAHARAPTDPQGDRAARLRVLGGSAQGPQIGLASDEHRACVSPEQRGGRGTAMRDAQSPQDLLADRALRWFALQEVHAQRVEIGRD